MPTFPTIDDSRITQDAPLDEDLMEDLRLRDVYLWQDADDGGDGIAPDIESFTAALAHHRHNGDPGQGESIPTAGIADGAASDPAMFQAECVQTGNIHGTTMGPNNLGTASVTAAKMTGRMGWPVTGSESYDTSLPAREGIDQIYFGDTMVVSNPKGEEGVIGNAAPTTSIVPTGDIDWHIRRVTASTIRFGLVYPGEGSGTWDVDCRIM